MSTIATKDEANGSLGSWDEEGEGVRAACDGKLGGGILRRRHDPAVHESLSPRSHQVRLAEDRREEAAQPPGANFDASSVPLVDIGGNNSESKVNNSIKLARTTGDLSRARRGHTAVPSSYLFHGRADSRPAKDPKHRAECIRKFHLRCLRLVFMQSVKINFIIPCMR